MTDNQNQPLLGKRLRRSFVAFLFAIVMMTGVIVGGAAGTAAAQSEGRPCQLGYLELTCYDNTPSGGDSTEDPSSDDPADSVDSPSDSNLDGTLVAHEGVDRARAARVAAIERAREARTTSTEGIPTNVRAHYDPKTGEVVITGLDTNGDAVSETGSDG